MSRRQAKAAEYYVSVAKLWFTQLQIANMGACNATIQLFKELGKNISLSLRDRISDELNRFAFPKAIARMTLEEKRGQPRPDHRRVRGERVFDHHGELRVRRG